MSEEIETKKPRISRREFLKDAGLIVGGATIGSIALVNACGGGDKTVTVGPTVTTTVAGSGGGNDTRTTFNVNGKEYKVEIQPYWSLSHVLRESLGLTALKIGCDRGECGHCTVLVNGKPIYSCLMLAVDAAAPATIETSESLSTDKINLHPIAQAYLDDMAYQCGFCTAGFMMTTKALLKNKGTAPLTMDQVKEELSGHLCVCSAIKSVCETVVKLGGA